MSRDIHDPWPDKLSPPPVPTSKVVKPLESDFERQSKEENSHRGFFRHTPSMKTYSLLLLASLTCAYTLLVFAAPPSPPQQLRFRDDTQRQFPSSSPDHYQAPASFPSQAFEKYYSAPDGYDHQPRPIITDIETGEPYPNSLDDPWQLPKGAPTSEATYPRPSGPSPPPKNILQDTISNITSIIASDSITSNCTKCISAIHVAQRLARLSPHDGPRAMIELCKKYEYGSKKFGLSNDEVCERQYAPATLGAQFTQILSYINLKEGEQDAQAICSKTFSYCDTPAPRNFTDAYFDEWFSKVGGRLPPAKPTKSKETHKGSRRPLKILHMSDIHLDPRFLVGSEAKCTSGQCCRADSFNSSRVDGPPTTPHTFLNSSSIVEKAQYWGNYLCDSPYSIVMSAFEAVKPLNGGKDVDMTLYTGDIVTHDADWHYSRDMVTQIEQAMYDVMKRYLGKGPVFSTLGNHDSSPSDSASADKLPEGHDTFSWNYEYLSKLWQAEGWFDHEEAKQVGKHYGGYSVSPTQGLRVISINTDFIYINNKWTVIEYNNPDLSGTLAWLTKELYRAERRGEKVYFIGHVSPGWDGTNALDNPTTLLTEIVRRFQHTIAHMFFGHSHEDFFSVFYNGTQRTANEAFAHAFVGPSITPLSRVNPSFGLYTVDRDTFEVLDHDVFYTDVSRAASLVEENVGPTWKHLYSARQAYNNFSASVQNHSYAGGVALDSQSLWPQNAPLNATFFASLTTEMQLRPELVQQFTVYQGRNSYLSPNCTSDECVQAKICYLRSANSLEGKKCPRGFNSVQPGNGKG